MNNNDLFFFMKMQYQDLEESLEKYLTEKNNGTFFPKFMDKDCGKEALRRKITTLRQILLRIEKGL